MTNLAISAPKGIKTYILIPVWLYEDFSANDNKQWKH